MAFLQDSQAKQGFSELFLHSRSVAKSDESSFFPEPGSPEKRYACETLP